jgi:phosphatidate cytidylyltransferase
MDKKKIAAALALIPFFTWLVGWGQPWHFLVLALPLGAMVGAYELARMVFPASARVERLLTVLFSGFLCVLAQTGEMDAAVAGLSAATILSLSALMLIHKDLDGVFPAAAKVVFGAVYVGLLVGVVVALKRLEPAAGGAKLLIILFALTWAGDAGAFFAGSLLGKHKLWPAVSAGKTWEGLVGGFISTLLIAQVAAAWIDIWDWRDGLIVGALIGVFGPVGDLVESAIKRGAGVKDSGVFLPGHGGVLDRIDSILFTAPILYYYVLWYGIARVSAF